MVTGIYARRYAQAIFEIALGREELEECHSDLGRVVRLAEDGELISMLKNPKVGFGDKARLLSEHLSGINPMVLNMVYLLVAKGRLGIVGDIVYEYQRLLDSLRGIERGEVMSVVPLSDENRERLAEHLGSVMGKKVMLTFRENPDILGGFVARVGGRLLDGSTRSRLEALRRDIISAGRR